MWDGVGTVFLRSTRLVILLGLMLGGAWFAFVVPLGDRTLSEHIDAISQTPEARGLVKGTRETLQPLVDEARDRILGEYVAAPTAITRGVHEQPARAMFERSEHNSGSNDGQASQVATPATKSGVRAHSGADENSEDHAQGRQSALKAGHGRDHVSEPETTKLPGHN